MIVCILLIAEPTFGVFLSNLFHVSLNTFGLFFNLISVIHYSRCKTNSAEYYLIIVLETEIQSKNK